jgi:hypothetical protein
MVKGSMGEKDCLVAEREKKERGRGFGRKSRGVSEREREVDEEIGRERISE